MYKSFKEMPVWEKAMQVAENVFRLTEKLPRKEDYGLTSQIRRAALSVAGNIAEGYGRNHSNDKINFYHIARGSATETQSHLEYGRRINYFRQEETERLDAELS